MMKFGSLFSGDKPREEIFLRDWFAGLSLMGMRSYNGVVGKSEHYAKQAYADADAMLKEREVLK